MIEPARISLKTMSFRENSFGSYDGPNSMSIFVYWKYKDYLQCALKGVFQFFNLKMYKTSLTR